MLNAEKFKTELSISGAHFALIKLDGVFTPFPCFVIEDCNECLFHQNRESVPPSDAVNCYDGRILWMLQEAE